MKNKMIFQKSLRSCLQNGLKSQNNDYRPSHILEVNREIFATSSLTIWHFAFIFAFLNFYRFSPSFRRLNKEKLSRAFLFVSFEILKVLETDRNTKKRVVLRACKALSPYFPSLRKVERIISFNSFYVFTSQENSLKPKLKKIANQILKIFQNHDFKPFLTIKIGVKREKPKANLIIRSSNYLPPLPKKYKRASITVSPLKENKTCLILGKNSFKIQDFLP